MARSLMMAWTLRLSVATAAICTLGGCDDGDPVAGGESGTPIEDDDGAGTTSGPSTTSTNPATSASGTATSTTTTSSTTPTPTTMDPTDVTGADSSSGECLPGEQGCPCDGGECEGSLECVNGTCESSVTCGVDLYEPNDSEEDAADLGELSDDDDDGLTISAVLEGDEVDWFVYRGTDGVGASVDPTRTLETVGALRMCKYLECDGGLKSTEVTCPEGTASNTSDAGRPGCCANESFEVEVNCTGTISEDTSVYLRFDQGQSDCTPYTLEFHY